MDKKVTVLFVGSFLSSSKGTKGIAEKMRPYLKGDYDLLYASDRVNKLRRMIDILKYSLFSNYDVVHCDVFSGQAFWVADLVRRIAGFRRKKIIVNIQGGRFLEYLGESATRLDTFQNWMSKELAIISPSKFLARGLKGLYNTNVQVVPNFIDLGNFPNNPDSKTGHRLLWVRAFREVYQPEIAIEALAILRRKYRDVSLTMVGPDRGELQRIREMIRRYVLEDCVCITGPVPNEDLFNYYQTHDVYLNTTAYESFGVAVFEAASSGIPMVSTEVGELPYIWNDCENIKFTAGHSGQDFANAVDELFEDRPQMELLRTSARSLVEGYSWGEIGPLWRRLLG